jgi:hypothetical protein
MWFILLLLFVDSHLVLTKQWELKVGEIRISAEFTQGNSGNKKATGVSAPWPEQTFRYLTGEQAHLAK